LVSPSGLTADRKGNKEGKFSRQSLRTEAKVGKKGKKTKGKGVLAGPIATKWGVTKRWEVGGMRASTTTIHWGA